MTALSNLLLLAQAQGSGGLLDLVMKLRPTPEAAGHSLVTIILLPLLGAFLCGVFGKQLGRANVHLIACGSVASAFVLSALTMWTLGDGYTTAPNVFGESTRYAVGWDFGTWFSAGDFRVNFGFYADHLSGAMLLVITGVGFLIHLYSTSYMEHDEGYARFFTYLNLFVAMMLTLVLADSLVLLFVGWEGVGMCSYLLIGFWYTDAEKAAAGKKAFIANRIGDFGFLVASFLFVMLLTAFVAQAPAENFAHKGLMSPDEAKAKMDVGIRTKGPLAFQTVEAFASSMGADDAGGKVSRATVVAEGPLKGRTFGFWITTILLCFLLGASGKSAQLPLYVWLPDAMAGPTPVSALIHAATMVTAGVYLFCRLSYLLVLSPDAMAVVALIGAATALLAALIAFAQDDSKKVLAYSTVSQLGFMFMGVGAGIFWAAFLHVVTHAFFKACLFLGAGSVMHGNGDETDIKKLGGLKHQMKHTWWTFGVATLAITGIVPLSGFFSKDAILHGIHTTKLAGHEHVLHVVWFMGLLAALCTAFYMTRLYVLMFEGERAPNARTPYAHESSLYMTVPLMILAVLSVFAIVHGLPTAWLPLQWFPGWQDLAPDKHEMFMENFMAPVFGVAQNNARTFGTFELEAHEGAWWAPLVQGYVMAWVIAMIGGASAWFLYRGKFAPRAGTQLAPWHETIRVWAKDKFYVDEFYGYPLRAIQAFAEGAYKVIDDFFINTIGVEGLGGSLPLGLGGLIRRFQAGDAQLYAVFMVLGLAAGVAFAFLKVAP